MLRLPGKHILFLIVVFVLSISTIGPLTVLARATDAMQLSPSALDKVIKLTNRSVPDYPQAYEVVYKDLQARYPQLTAAEQDTLTWLSIARQVNQGDRTFDTLAIRAVNAVAVKYRLGKTISLFGSEEQDASNAVARGFFTTLKQNKGLLPSFADIIQADASNGTVHSLGLSKADWGGALPDDVAESFTGFQTDTYYDTLTPDQQQEADQLHIAAGAVLMSEFLAERAGLSQNLVDKVTAVTIQNQLALSAPVNQQALNLGSYLLDTVNKYRALNQIMQSVTKNVTTTFITNAETALENLFGLNQAVDPSKGMYEVGPDINLDLSKKSDPRSYLDLSSSNGVLTVISTTPALRYIATDVRFVDNSGVLVLKNPQDYQGTIYNFTAGDTIDLAGIGLATSATLDAQHVLTVTRSGGARPLTLQFDPTQKFQNSTFIITSDQHGGTNISLLSPYTFTQLAVPTSTIAYAINDAGTIAGGGPISAKGFVGTPNNFQTFDYQPNLQNDVPDQHWDVATGINNNGQMVGYSGISDFALTNPDTWLSTGGGFSNIVAPGSQFTIANAINDNGQVVGQYPDNTPNSNLHGFLDTGGAITTIDEPGSNTTNLVGINKSGEIVGQDDTGGFLYKPATDSQPATFTHIVTPGGASAYVTAINNNGLMTGYFHDQAGMHGFVTDGTNFTIFALPASDAYPRGINDAGDIVCGGSAGSFLGVPTASAA